jgi:hypothetical protein
LLSARKLDGIMARARGQANTLQFCPGAVMVGSR